ncbi:MAG: T9SS type A sorting domain-containing protein [Bacteroidota bacterium]
MRNVTLALVALAAVALAPQATAQCSGTAGTDFQQVTVRQINAIPQTNIDALNSASDAGTIDIGQIQTGLTNALEGELVEFTAVFLSDPLLSGLATATDGIPSRIHAFLRDTTAASEGVEGMGIQIVDNRGDGQIQQFFPGDEVVVCGTVSPFTGSGGKTMQIAPVSITATGKAYDANDPLRQPVVISIDDVHDAMGQDTQLDFGAFSDFNSQYVRFEGATLVQGIPGTRAEALFSDAASGDAPQIHLYDTSVCFRNDRDASYFPAGQVPSCINDDFVPPSTGTVNVQGFLTFQGDEGNFGYATPGGAVFSFNPMADADFEITSAPPIVTLDPIGSIPAPADNVTISATAVAAQGALTGVAAAYRYVLDGTEIGSGNVALSNTSGDTYEGTIPSVAGSNGAFVEFTVTATDDAGGMTDVDGGYLVFEGAVNSIALIQTTAPGVDSASPLYTGANGDNNADDARTFDLDAVVQTVFQRGSSWYGTLQDDEALGAWTGIWVFFGADDPGLSAGDRINITQAAINERFGVTQLQDLTYTTTSSGSPYAYKSVDTGVLADDAVAEAHEGMLLTFDNVTITNNDTGFGEWAMSTNGTAPAEADDWSDAFASDYSATTFTNDEVREFVRGIWWFSFGEYKMVPVTLDDIGAVSTATEGGIQARSIRIQGSHPNPVSGTATVAFELDVDGPAALRLFDVTGRQVATLADGAFTAQSHTATLDVAGLAPGVYILRLEAAGEVATARIAVVR